MTFTYLRDKIQYFFLRIWAISHITCIYFSYTLHILNYHTSLIFTHIYILYVKCMCVLYKTGKIVLHERSLGRPWFCLSITPFYTLNRFLVVERYNIMWFACCQSLNILFESQSPHLLLCLQTICKIDIPNNYPRDSIDRWNTRRKVA